MLAHAPNDQTAEKLKRVAEAVRRFDDRDGQHIRPETEIGIRVIPTPSVLRRLSEESRWVLGEALRIALDGGSNYVRPQDLRAALKAIE